MSVERKDRLTTHDITTQHRVTTYQACRSERPQSFFLKQVRDGGRGMHKYRKPRTTAETTDCCQVFGRKRERNVNTISSLERWRGH